GRGDEPALPGGQAELGAEERREEAVEGDVPGVEHVAEPADDEDLALYSPLPGEVLHDLVAGTHEVGSVLGRSRDRWSAHERVGEGLEVGVVERGAAPEPVVGDVGLALELAQLAVALLLLRAVGQ